MEETSLSSSSITEQGEGGRGSTSSSSPLRRRKTKKHRRVSYTVNGLDGDDSNGGGKSTWNRTAAVGATQESVFFNMHIRKVHRRVKGQYNKFSNDGILYEFAVVVALSFAIHLWQWNGSPITDYYFWGGFKDFDPCEEYRTLICTLMAIFVCFFVVIYVMRDSPHIRTLRYMLIYIPLLCYSLMISYELNYGYNVRAKYIYVNQTWASIYFIHDKTTMEYPNLEQGDLDIDFDWQGFIHQRKDKYDSHKKMGLNHLCFVLELFIFLEVVTFFGFVTLYKCLPSLMQLDWPRKKPGRVSKLWKITAAADDPWVMRYRGQSLTPGSAKCQLDYMCQYEGGVDESSGLPDGLGRWIDDALGGEMLTGYWKQGEPVAPFSSWTVENDAAVVAVRVGYFKATDDPFSKNKIHSTNDQNPPECGVASVECSVSGSFYRHLPHTTLIEGPYVTDAMPTPQNNPIRDMLSHMFQASEKDESAIHICAADSRGVQVSGHIYEPTGRHFSCNVESISVDVEWSGCEEGTNAGATNDQNELTRIPLKRKTAHSMQKALFMPKANREPLYKLVDVEIEDSSNEDSDYVENEGDDIEAGSTDFDLQEHSTPRMSQRYYQQTTTLRVRDWVPAKFKEALIFCHGYNSCMEKSLNTMGQFLAMTKLSQHVYPIVFVWPGSANVGYPYASKISATDINQQNMLKLVRGLKEAGIRRFHFLTHSMGAQTLMGAFRDKYDTNGIMTGRSDVSKEFTLDPDFDTTEGPKEGKRQQYTDRITCRSITLMNPDFPVEAFVDRGFETIRRVCSTITIVGDKRDRALGMSSLMNRVAPHFGYKQPQVLWPTIAAGPRYKPRSLVKRIGRSVKDLYFPSHLAREHLERGKGEAFCRLLFNKSPLRGQVNAHNTSWLDIDVIDMTGLDTNIKGMRHNGFSLNGMLLKDLQELLSTGKRAMSRSTLLYRKGNQFSFVRAPAFVV